MVSAISPFAISPLLFAVPGSAEVDPGDSGDDWVPPQNWYGNIQYLINLSLIGALCCVLLFLVVKLRSDHRLPGLASLAAKLLSVWHATGQQIALLCGADASQYLAVEGYTFLGFLTIAVFALVVVLPLNIYGGTVPIQDQFSRSLVIHIAKGSGLLWWHYVFMVFVVGVMHLCVNAIHGRLTSTQFNGEAAADCTAAFTLMIHGIPRNLSANKRLLQEYFEHLYPGKIFRVTVPPDLSTFYNLEKELVKTRKHLSWLQARQQDTIFIHDEEEDEEEEAQVHKESKNGVVRLVVRRRSCLAGLRQSWRMCKSIVKQIWLWFLACGGCGEDDIITRLQERCAEIEKKLLPYKEGTALGAGIAFVVFKDLRTASRALQDIKSSSKRNDFDSQYHLGRSRWKVERAPSARDIHWHHLGSSTMSRIVRRVIVNTFLLLLLFFCSSPLAAFTALHNAGRLLNPEAMDHLQTWLVWVQSSSWAAAIVLQFLPNLLIFLSMYLIIPATLAYVSSFESHLTLSGEQRAALTKTVLFFLVNLIFLRGLLETSLEAALLHMKDCYEEGIACKEIQQYMSSSFVANSCLSATAFLITSSFLGISYDLLSPIPWIKQKLQQLRKQQSEEFTSGDSTVAYETVVAEESLQERLLPSNFSTMDARTTTNSMGIDVEGQVPPTSALARDSSLQWQTFDYVQYHAFNLTIFAMALIYSSFAPVIVPIAALYFGYRYFVDKYNFLFMYKGQGFAATNDGKLLRTVIRVMKICIILYLLAMLYFFYVRGDPDKLQFLCTLAVVVLVTAKYGIENLFCPSTEGFHIAVIESLGSIDNYVNGSLEYEIFAQPNLNWDTASSNT